MATTKDLERRLDALEERVEALQKELLEDKVDSLRSRLEELEVQLNLGGKEARDEIAPLLEQLRNRMLDLRALVERATAAGGEALTAAADNVRSAASDLRTRLEDATSRLRRGGEES